MTQLREPSPSALPSQSLTSRAALFAAFLALLAPPSAAFASQKKAPPPRPATGYAAYDSHPAEHVTIAADPCEEPKKCDFFRLPYVQHGLLPVRVIITNDSDHTLSLDDVRIQFISSSNDVIPAATDDEINRRFFTFKNAEGTKIPIIPVTIHHPVDKKITEDENDFGFTTTTVQPHSTLAGYLFYDIKGLDDPPLKDAQIYVKMIRTKDDSQELFAFSIPFNKWLAANPDAPSNHPRQ